MKRFLFFIMLALLPTMIMSQVARGEIKRPKNVKQRTAATKIPAVKKGKEDAKSRIICPDSNHPHMIDLALPSGTLWACCNVGASRPDDFGHYFAWGETKNKSDYRTDTYQYGNDKDHLMNIGFDIAGTKFDAATANWGSPWRTPTNSQCNELIDNTTSRWTTYNGMSGRVFTSKKNGHTIFPQLQDTAWPTSFSTLVQPAPSGHRQSSGIIRTKRGVSVSLVGTFIRLATSASGDTLFAPCVKTDVYLSTVLFYKLTQTILLE